MRGKKALINTGIAVLQELVVVICGFILPRLILSAYGSTYNGITNSITQFLACAVLLRAGIGGATRVALYKPIAENDKDKINGIMSATNLFMKKIALILGGLIIGFACIYPFFVIDEFGWLFSFSLFIIIGISTFAESLLGVTYLILLQADQKLYVSSLFHIFVYILNTIIAAILICAGSSIHIVKLGSSLAFAVYPIALNIYVRSKYKVDLHAKPDNQSIYQRWDAFFHQAANFATTNTGTIILTVFSTMLEVSVYSVYNLVVNGLRKLVLNFTNGLEAAFGNMIVVDDKKTLQKNFSLIEYIIFSVATVIYTCTAILILQFISIYTKGITDVEYHRPLFAYIVIIAQFFYCVRQPYQLVVQAAGHYRQTKKGAIMEVILNLTLSVIFVIKFGLVGVAFGGLAAAVFRTAQYAHYMSKNILAGCFSSMLKKCLISMVEAALIILIYSALPMRDAETYFTWCMHGLIAVSIAMIVIISFSLLLFKTDMELFWIKMKKILLNKNIKQSKTKDLLCTK